MSCTHAGTAGPGGVEDCLECWKESHHFETSDEARYVEPPGLLPLTQAVLDAIMRDRPRWGGTMRQMLDQTARSHIDWAQKQAETLLTKDGWTRERLAVTGGDMGRIRIGKPHLRLRCRIMADGQPAWAIEIGHHWRTPEDRNGWWAHCAYAIKMAGPSQDYAARYRK